LLKNADAPAILSECRVTLLATALIMMMGVLRVAWCRRIISHSGQHFILAVPQPELQQLGKIRFIIHDQNQLSHARVLLHQQGAAMTTT